MTGDVKVVPVAPIMGKQSYSEEIQDEVTGEVIILEADSLEELDDMVASHLDLDVTEN